MALALRRYSGMLRRIRRIHAHSRGATPPAKSAPVNICPSLDVVFAHCFSCMEGITDAVVAVSMQEYVSPFEVPMLPGHFVATCSSACVPLPVLPLVVATLRARYRGVPVLIAASRLVCLSVVHGAASANQYSISADFPFHDALSRVIREHMEDLSPDDAEHVFAAVCCCGSPIPDDRLLELWDELSVTPDDAEEGVPKDVPLLHDLPLSYRCLETVFRSARPIVVARVLSHCLSCWVKIEGELPSGSLPTLATEDALKLTYALLWNVTWKNSDDFDAIHRLFIHFITCFKFRFHDTPMYVSLVSAVLIKIGRNYGGKHRALELGDVYRTIKSSHPTWLLRAPSAFWNWCLGSIVDFSVSETHVTQTCSQRNIAVSSLATQLWDIAMLIAEDAITLSKDLPSLVTAWRLLLKAALLMDPADFVKETSVRGFSTAGRVLDAYELLASRTAKSDWAALLDLLDVKAIGSQFVRWMGQLIISSADSQRQECMIRIIRVLPFCAHQRPFAAVDFTIVLFESLAKTDHAEGTSSHSCGELLREWIDDFLAASGSGLGSTETIGALIDAAAGAGVLPASPFRWTCGCGATMPAASPRCTRCLRSALHCAWTCPACRKPQPKAPGLRIRVLAPNTIELQKELLVCACGATHPWAAAMRTHQYSACVSCGSLVADSCSVGEIHVCESCYTTAVDSDPQPHDSQQVDETPSPTIALHPSSAACAECGTVASPNDNLCRKCGVVTARGAHHKLTMWCCVDCSTWNPSFTTTCRQDKGHKRSPAALAIPANPWTCGCGSNNGPLRVSCYTCTAKQQQSCYLCVACRKHTPSLAKRRTVVIAGYTSRKNWTVNVSQCTSCGADHPAMDTVLRYHVPDFCTGCGNVTDPTCARCPSCGSARDVDRATSYAQWSCNNCSAVNCTGFVCEHCDGLQPELELLSASGEIGSALLWKCSAPISRPVADPTTGSDGFAPLQSCGHWNPSWKALCERCESRRVLHLDEVRARYIPWTCVGCGTRNAARQLLYCSNCALPRVPHACPSCGLSHVAWKCPSLDLHL